MLEAAALGVDIGSVSVSLAVLAPGGELVATAHRAHRGRPAETLRGLLEGLGPLTVRGVGVTTTSPATAASSRRYDSQVSLIAGCRRFTPDVRSIVVIGGERFGLVRFDAAGRYRGARTSSSCAAGTGSFLDQQARRLGLPDSAALAAAALASTTEPPRISTRCAVFARTDLVHAQQEGYTLAEICDGLCRGLALNIADTLLKGEKPDEPVVCAGGVALNAAVVRHLARIVGCPVHTLPESPVMAAVGAALRRIDDGALEAPFAPDASSLLPVRSGEKQYYYAPLVPQGRADHHFGAMPGGPQDYADHLCDPQGRIHDFRAMPGDPGAAAAREETTVFA
ncbi:MAG TPA: BadF/BadG/BcrA/BcrD ATPase family protein, partial [Spirochaetia bacterium]